MSSDSIFRRSFLRTTVAAIGIAGTTIATADTSAAQGEMPEFSELEGIDGGIADLRGENEVTVKVGAEGNGGSIAFAPAGIWIDPGTTVTWDWIRRGPLNVTTVDGPAEFNSDLIVEEGTTYEFEFTEEHEGITNYQCDPAASLGMVGAVAVGDDVPTVAVSDDDSTGDNANDAVDATGETADESPGFGVVGTLSGIGTVGYLLRRRLLADSEP